MRDREKLEVDAAEQIREGLALVVAGRGGAAAAVALGSALGTVRELGDVAAMLRAERQILEAEILVAPVSALGALRDAIAKLDLALAQCERMSNTAVYRRLYGPENRQNGLPLDPVSVALRESQERLQAEPAEALADWLATLSQIRAQNIRTALGLWPSLHRKAMGRPRERPTPSP